MRNKGMIRDAMKEWTKGSASNSVIVIPIKSEKGLAVNEYHKKSEVFGGEGRTIIWEVEKPSNLSLNSIMQIPDGNMT